jgi:Mg-chelatase subunit ChlD
VTAAIFFGIPAVKTRLILFDTSIVDVTDYCTDPVETLMKVQLGGGTDIAQALVYAEGRVENPRRTIVVLITDFFEGGPPNDLYAVTKRLVESGVTLLGLAALDSDATPHFDRDVARRMATLGAHVGAMTPGELAAFVAEKVR